MKRLPNPLRPAQVPRRVQRRGTCYVCGKDVAVCPNGEAGWHMRADYTSWCPGYCFLALDVREA